MILVWYALFVMFVFPLRFCWNKGNNELGKDLDRAYVKAPLQNVDGNKGTNNYSKDRTAVFVKIDGETENVRNDIDGLFVIEGAASRTHHLVKRATTTPFVLTQEQKNFMVKLHNDARAMVTPPASDMQELVSENEKFHFALDFRVDLSTNYV